MGGKMQGEAIGDADVSPEDMARRLRELELSEKSLRESGERYRNIIESIEDGYFEVDLRGSLTFCNQALARMYGRPREEIMHIGYRDYTTPEVAKIIFDAFNQVYRTGTPMKVLNYETIRPDGSLVQLEVSVSLMRDEAGQPVGFRGITRDVSERRRLAEENERYRVFVENVTDACLEYDLTGKCTFCNEMVHQLLGYTREEYMQLSHQERYTTEEDADRSYAASHEVYLTGIPVKIYEDNVRCKDGSVKFFEVSLSLIRDNRGNPKGFRGIGRDLTDRKKMAERQEKMAEQLQQAQKMEAIGTLAGGIAHAFNNLLMGIQGNASLVMLGSGPDSPHYAKLQAIESLVQSGADLTRQLLGYAQSGRYEVKPTDLNALISQTSAMFGRTRKEIRIRETYTPDLWRVEVDRSQFEQVILNLLVNAWQAMPGGGDLYLETSNILIDEAYAKPYGIEAGPYVRVSVTDTGIGMDEQTRQRIFDPFFTTQEMGRGRGLGLASAYGIVKGHRGVINVYSEKGHGTTFTLYLPASDKEAQKATAAVPAMMPGRETILLVDDEKMIREVTAEILEELGYQVVMAGCGEEAVEIYRARREGIHLVIMDMIMPGLGGGEAFDRIKALDPDVKVILSSGYSLEGKAQDIMGRGVKAFLQKPFRFTDLSRKIREVLAA